MASKSDIGSIMDTFGAWEAAQSSLIDTADKQERALAAGIAAAHPGLPPVPSVQKSPPEQVNRSRADQGGGGEFDPLMQLYRQERALIVAGTRGEAVGDQLQDVRNSIRRILEHQAAQQEAQHRPRDQDRGR